MPTPIDIIAIEGRTDVSNGISRPFRCVGEDEAEYFVKLKNVGWNHLVKEWVAGRLAQEMGLPVAEFAQVRIAPELIAGKPEWETDLGHGIAFSSRRVTPAERLSLAYVPQDPDGSLSRILLFDWWTRNSDRALTETGGNPNLLWQVDSRRVIMFDHDNAFDENFDPGHFWQFHALRSHRGAWEAGRELDSLHWLTEGFARLDGIWDELPEEWLTDPYGDPRCTLDKAGLMAVLSSFQTNQDFWSLPTSP